MPTDTNYDDFQSLNPENGGVVTPVKELGNTIKAEIDSRPPERWWGIAYKGIRRALRDADTYPEELRDFISTRGPEFTKLLTHEIERDVDSENTSADRAQLIAERAIEIIHDAAKIFPLEAEPNEKDPVINFVPIEEIIDASDRFNLAPQKLADGRTTNVLQVYSDTTSSWYDFKLPFSENVMHKGGFPRVVLKVLAGAPVETIEAELPPNDFDVVAVIADGTNDEAALLDADPAGIEHVDEFDMNSLIRNRDINLNGCFMTKDGLVYSEPAFEAARSGRIELMPYKRLIYGTETFYYKGERITNNRGMMRLAKTVVEQKALSFDFRPINKQVDMGIYWLALAQKFSGKTNHGELLDKLYYVGAQMGQVRTGENDIYDVLNRAHTEFPFFEMERKELDEVGVAKWLGNKLNKQIDRVYRQEYKVGSDFELEREPGDTIPYTVSLDGYEKNDEAIDAIEQKWDSFKERCQMRTLAYRSTDQ